MTDENGEPIIGANVVEKGTTNGTVTDLDGKFTMEVSENGVLQISYIGYAMTELRPGKEANLNVKLREDALQMDEVVVVGYGTVKERTWVVPYLRPMRKRLSLVRFRMRLRLCRRGTRFDDYTCRRRSGFGHDHEGS